MCYDKLDRDGGVRVAKNSVINIRVEAETKNRLKHFFLNLA